MLRSPENAKRLFAAIEESIERDNLSDEMIQGESLEELVKEVEQPSDYL